MIKRKPFKFIVLIVCIFMLVLFPSSIGRPNQAETKGVVIAMGIDKVDNQFEVSLQMIQPAQGLSYTDNLIITTHKGPTISQAIDLIGLNVGKEVGFAHCKVLVLGDSACQDNVIDLVDFFLRTGLLGSSMSVINTDKNAKDLLEASSQGINKQVNSVQFIMDFNKQYVHATEVHLNTLLTDYLSPTQVSLMSTLSIKEEEKGETNVGAGGSEAGDGAGGQMSESQPKELLNEGKTSVFKAGKKIGVLSEDEIRGRNWILNKTTKGNTQVEHINSEHFSDASVVAALVSKNLSYVCNIVQNKPIITYDLNINMRIVETEQDSNRVLFDSNETYFDNELKAKLEDTIKAQVQAAATFAKDNNADIADFYNKFNITNTKGWKKYLDSLGSQDDYLKEIVVVANVKVNGRM